jgi:hypothetical protein
MLAPAHQVDRLVELLGAVKLVMHDGRVRCGRAGGLKVGLPHIDGNRGHALALRLRNRFPQLVGGLASALRHHIKNSPRHHVVENRDIVVPLAEALLIEPEVGQILQRPSIQSARHRTFHDPIHLIPGQLSELPSGYRAPTTARDNRVVGGDL